MRGLGLEVWSTRRVFFTVHTQFSFSLFFPFKLTLIEYLVQPTDVLTQSLYRREILVLWPFPNEMMRP
jgi:hypothetical protein